MPLPLVDVPDASDALMMGVVGRLRGGGFLEPSRLVLGGEVVNFPPLFTRLLTATELDRKSNRVGKEKVGL